jgi:hypothetical protein
MENQPNELQTIRLLYFYSHRGLIYIPESQIKASVSKMKTLPILGLLCVSLMGSFAPSFSPSQSPSYSFLTDKLTARAR